MLSPYLKSLNNKRCIPTEKLIPNLMDKKDYVVLYRNLKFYVGQGLKVTAVKKVLSYRQTVEVEVTDALLSARRPRASSRPTWPSSWLTPCSGRARNLSGTENRFD